jgi:hypothetical protein
MYGKNIERVGIELGTVWRLVLVEPKLMVSEVPPYRLALSASGTEVDGF